VLTVWVALPRLAARSRPGFLTGPEDLADAQSPINVPRVHIGPDGQPHFLIIYQFAEIKVIFFLPINATTQARVLDMGFYTSLHQFLAKRLQELAHGISQLQLRKPAYVPRPGPAPQSCGGC